MIEELDVQELIEVGDGPEPEEVVEPTEPTFPIHCALCGCQCHLQESSDGGGYDELVCPRNGHRFSIAVEPRGVGAEAHEPVDWSIGIRWPA